MGRVIPLREWRERRLLTQRALAERSGVAQSTIVRLERGEPAEIRTIRKLVQALGMAVEEAMPGAREE